jgi:hypothetical protein
MRPLHSPHCPAFRLGIPCDDRKGCEEEHAEALAQDGTLSITLRLACPPATKAGARRRIAHVGETSERSRRLSTDRFSLFSPTSTLFCFPFPPTCYTRLTASRSCPPIRLQGRVAFFSRRFVLSLFFLEYRSSRSLTTTGLAQGIKVSFCTLTWHIRSVVSSFFAVQRGEERKEEKKPRKSGLSLSFRGQGGGRSFSRASLSSSRKEQKLRVSEKKRGGLSIHFAVTMLRVSSFFSLFFSSPLLHSFQE